MTVRQYLEKLNEGLMVTFIKARARKDAHTPFYHPEYQTTPIFMAREWLDGNNARFLDSTVLNDKQMPIDWLCGAQWGAHVRKGTIKCLLIISEDDFALLYNEAQRGSMVQFIDEHLDF